MSPQVHTAPTTHTRRGSNLLQPEELQGVQQGRSEGQQGSWLLIYSICAHSSSLGLQRGKIGTGVESGGFSLLRGLSHFPQGFAQVPQLLL